MRRPVGGVDGGVCGALLPPEEDVDLCEKQREAAEVGDKVVGVEWCLRGAIG